VGSHCDDGQKRMVLVVWAILVLAAADSSRSDEQSESAIVPDSVVNEQSGCGPAVVLPKGEYRLWEGEWVMEGSDIAENVYSILRIHAVHSGGLVYGTECRDIPYGPNATWSNIKEARFEGSLQACSPDSETRLRLSVDPDDRHARVIEMKPLECSHTDVPSNLFVLRRTIFRAGFDCARAGTPVEHAICGNELIAQGDFEVGELYRKLRSSLPEDLAQELRSGQRAWLRLRNDRCTSGDVADETCLAHQYADRLATLSRLADPTLGGGDLFDSSYALAQIVRGTDLRLHTAARLAMYPLAMDPAGETDWQAGPDGLLFEQTYVKTRIVWPSNVEFRYSDMLYVDRDGTVWVVEYTETAQPLPSDWSVRADRLWLSAGREPLTVQTETEPGAPYPPRVARWLDEHGVDQAMVGK